MKCGVQSEVCSVQKFYQTNTTFIVDKFSLVEYKNSEETSNKYIRRL